MSEENKVIQLDDYRQHSVIEAKCSCGKEWIAVIQTNNEGVLECPACGEMVKMDGQI